jgi:hypothetical protein
MVRRDKKMNPQIPLSAGVIASRGFNFRYTQHLLLAPSRFRYLLRLENQVKTLNYLALAIAKPFYAYILKGKNHNRLNKS